MNKIFNWSNVFGTITIFLTIAFLQQITVRSEFLHVFEKALSDYNVTDLVFSKLRNEDIALDTNIVIVNTGGLRRADIAAQINLINRHNPKVIAINHIFEPSNDFFGDSVLAVELSKVKNLVLLSTTAQPKETSQGLVWDSLITSYPEKYKDIGITGSGRIITGGQEQFETWRTVYPSRKLSSGQEEKCFAGQVAQLFDPKLAQKFYSRDNKEENIHFRGNLDKFIKLDVDDVFDQNFVPEMITGKVVLFGYLGESYTSSFWDGDKFYTPMNDNQVGRGIPDTYGIIIQANIVSMILSEDYIDEIYGILSIFIAVLMCYFNVAWFTAISQSRAYGIWYDLITKIIQLFEVIIFVWIIIQAFATFNLKLDFTIAIFAILLSGDIMEIYLSLVVNAAREVRTFFRRGRP